MTTHIPESFDLYREAKYQYELIVPEQIEGLVLLSLFEQFGSESFKEEQINAIIDRVHHDLGKSTQRTEYDRNNSIVLKLQEFYLSRDESKKQYRFKTFGLQFCKNIKERLLGNYNPAKIKRLFDGLLVDLKRYLETADYTFDLWFEEHFIRIFPEITAHVEILDQQVSQSVREFRKRIKNEKENIHVLLDDIIIRLDGIKGQANELKAAFASTYEIDAKVEEVMIDGIQGTSTQNINKVFEFNGSIRGQLEQISTRIDHIKPKVREFIYEFNQRDFDRKSAMFLDLLIKRSNTIKNEAGKRIISLPAAVPGFQISDQASLPRFVVVPEKDIAPKIPAEALIRSIDTERQKEMIRLEKIKVWERGRVSYWIKEIKERLEQTPELDYGKMFFEILQKENSKLQIPVKVTSKVVRELPKQKQYSIKVSQEIIRNLLYPNIKIWKMSIQKI
nr:hypothetical protein [uncultured Pedobacter sp.]